MSETNSAEAPPQAPPEMGSADEAGSAPRRDGEHPAGGDRQAHRERRSAEPPDDADVRARPGRRTVEERQRAVLEGWRQDALGGIAESLRRGSGKTPRELELEREVEQLKRVVTTTAIEKCLFEQALDIERKKRPTVPARSRR
jgi:hypothetical protein